MPLSISIILPCFNSARTIARALDSCLAQSEARQIIVVDDCSYDSSTDIVMRYVRQHPHVHLIRMSENGGPARARNAGALCATSPLLAFLDADDEYMPNALFNAVVALRNAPSHNVIRLNLEFCGYPDDILAFKDFAKHAEIMNNMVTSTLVIRRSAFDALGGFPEDAIYREFGGEDGTLQSAIMFFFGYARLTGDKNVRNHYHSGSHVARYFRRMMGQLDSPPHAVRALAESVEQFVERARVRISHGTNAHQKG